MTESRFLNELLEPRLFIDPLLPAFQEITLGVDAFRVVLNAGDDKKLEAAAAEVARKNVLLARKLYESSGRSLSFQELVTDVLGRYGNWFAIEGNINRTKGWVMLSHGHGPRWSTFLSGYLAAAYHTFSDEKPDVTVEDQYVRIVFTTNQRQMQRT